MTGQLRAVPVQTNPILAPNTAPYAGLTAPNTIMSSALVVPVGVPPSAGCPAPVGCGGSLDMSA